MFKLLYKTFLISIMSGSLSIMNMTAFAQDTSGATAQMSKAAPSGYTRDSNGVLKKTETNKFDSVGGSDMLASITMLATGAIAARMAIAYKSNLGAVPTDVMIAAVGGIAFIAGEVMSNMKYKNTMDAMTADVTKSSDGKTDQAQIDRLQDLKKSYEEAKKTTSTKKTLQMAAAAAFGIASATSIYLSFQEDAMDAACTGAMTTAQAGLKTCAASAATGVGATEAAACSACMAELTPYQVLYNANTTETKIPEPTNIKEAKAKAKQAMLDKPPCLVSTGATVKVIASGITSACKPALTMKKVMEVFTPAPKAVVTGSIMLNNILFGGQRAVATNYELYQSRESDSLFYKSLNLLFPKAEASWLPLLGLGAGALASFTLISGTLGTAIDTQMFVPMNRAIAFGVLAGLSFLAANASQDQMDKIDANIKKIDQILADLNTMQKGVQSTNVGEQQIQLAAFNPNNTQPVQINPNAAVKTDCATSSGSSNCPSISGQISSMPGFATLPDSFKSIASQTAKLGDGLSGTNVISGSTLGTASSLAGKQNAIAKLLGRTQAKFNEQQVAMGKPAVDFGKEQKDLLDRLNGQAAKVLNSRGMSAGDFLASVGGTPLSNSHSAVAATPASKKFTPTAGINAGSAMAPSSSAKDKAFDLDFKEAPAGALAAGGAPQKEEKFDIGSNDINTNSGESIFQLISNRYIKSGYPKLLDEIPEAPVKK